MKENFLQVNICEWQEAFATLPRISFGLYLYLCGNQDKFHLALSSVDVQKSLGVSDSSYRRAVEDLLAAGYLMMRNGNEHTLDFYTTPQPTDYVKKERKKKSGGAAAPVVPDAPATSRQPMKKTFIPLFPSLTIEPSDLLFFLIFTHEMRKLSILYLFIYLYISLFMEEGFFPTGGQRIPVHEEKSAIGTIRHP